MDIFMNNGGVLLSNDVPTYRRLLLNPDIFLTPPL
jgi:hypothetical protein